MQMMTPPGPPSAKRNFPRKLLMLPAILALLAGLWAGLLRIGWQLPTLSAQLLMDHGPLMIAGFLGTVISLERAVALSQLFQGRRIFFLTPLLAALGSIAILLPIPIIIPRLMVTLAGLGFLITFIIIYRIQPATHNGVMAVGALLWLVGNGLWLIGWPVFRVFPWWAGYLVLTIAGERLELARVLILKRAARGWFMLTIAVFLVGLVVSLFAYDPGLRISGAGFAALGVWLWQFDVARRTIRHKALPQFIAACLLPGYIWLTFGGLLWLWFGGQYPAGPVYDAMLHTIFVGFVLSMIFGHAPVIIPAVLGMPIKFSPVFYVHLVLLHLSLALRLAGDLFFWHSLRQWGGLLNEVAVILFLAVTVVAARRGQKEQVN